MTEERFIGRYEIVEPIGRGMQGTVYLANDPDLDRRVAIKLLHSESTDLEPQGSASPPLEARIASRLRHPNIVSIFDIGYLNGSVYLVFEYVQGETLRQLLSAHGVLPIERVCEIAAPILDAIAHAHAQGVIHLDLSPRNVLIDADGNPRVMDFGLSQMLDNQMHKRQADEVTGSLFYMSPEHFSSEPLGTYTDVFALGAILYQLACGRPPVEAETVADVARGIMQEPPNMSLLPDSPHAKDFSTFLEGSLCKDPAQRYRDGTAMKHALAQFLRQHPMDDWSDDTPHRSHSTVQFLLRRMSRKEDFPSISRVLTDINRLTNEGNNTSVKELTEVILRDYGLTSKLLKLVNSPLYARVGGKVSSISRAIVLLGFDSVRSTAYSLAYFSKMHSELASPQLRDSMLSSFLSGLLARMFVERLGLADSEEAFICGLFQNLGENLVIYYFPDDYAEIRELTIIGGVEKQAASQRVLGVGFTDIGVEVAKIWQLPELIVATIRGDEPIQRSSPTRDELMRASAVFANEICHIAYIEEDDWQDSAFRALVDRYRRLLGLSRKDAIKLYAEAVARLLENASVLDVDVAASPFIKSVHRWLGRIGGGREAGAPPLSQSR